MGMGKSAADALPELRRKGIAASGNTFIMGGRRMDAAGIANALRLQVRRCDGIHAPVFFRGNTGVACALPVR